MSSRRGVSGFMTIVLRSVFPLHASVFNTVVPSAEHSTWNFFTHSSASARPCVATWVTNICLPKSTCNQPEVLSLEIQAEDGIVQFSLPLVGWLFASNAEEAVNTTVGSSRSTPRG